MVNSKVVLSSMAAMALLRVKVRLIVMVVVMILVVVMAMVTTEQSFQERTITPRSCRIKTQNQHAGSTCSSW